MSGTDTTTPAPCACGRREGTAHYREHTRHACSVLTHAETSAALRALRARRDGREPDPADVATVLAGAAEAVELRRRVYPDEHADD